MPLSEAGACHGTYPVGIAAQVGVGSKRNCPGSIIAESKLVAVEHGWFVGQGFQRGSSAVAYRPTGIE